LLPVIDRSVLLLTQCGFMINDVRVLGSKCGLVVTWKYDTSMHVIISQTAIAWRVMLRTLIKCWPEHR